MNLGVTKLPFLMIFGLLGCAETQFQAYSSGEPLRSYAYKAGATPESTERAETNCQIEAAQRVPQQLISQTSPSYTTPVQTYCNNIGGQTFCNSTGGQTYGGETTISDANTGLRQRAYGQCMAREGYRYLDIPACAAGTATSSLRASSTGGLLPLSSTTCYIATPDNQVYVGNRA
jgi:hypothetical protein